MSLSLQQMRDLVRKGLGNLTEQDMPDEHVDVLLNLSLWQMTANYPFNEALQRSTFTTVDGIESYSISSEIEASASVLLDALQGMSVLDSNGKSHKLQRMTESWLDTQYSTDSTFRGLPEYYLRRNDLIVFWPVPDDAYTVRAFYRIGITEMVYLSQEETGLPREWDEICVEGAITRAHYYEQDYNLAQQAENFRVQKIRTMQDVPAKEEEDSRFAGLIVQWDEPE